MDAGYRGQAPAPIEAMNPSATVSGGGIDSDYDYGVYQPSPTESDLPEDPFEDEFPPLPRDHPDMEGKADDPPDGDDSVLDMAQVEELHNEAERMKALGNKHMAAQEYTKAFNAYSAALQLSPVGPSSHVYLSNRAAALLSLKKYEAAATDARRAVVLAPTFGKAHARLGQSLYFLKKFEGAVSAYEDAVLYEPENNVTKTYLDKARSKLTRQREKAARLARGDEVSAAEESTVAHTIANSVATDPHRSAAVVTTGGFRGSSKVIARAIKSEPPLEQVEEDRIGQATPTFSEVGDPEEDDDDPDFEEALRIQERAHKYLALKRYKPAIEEFSAALFLVPDDPNLSTELHLGRAHALNGLRRHESARIDSLLAIKKNPTLEGYSTLAKSEYYLRDYPAAVEAFEQCIDLLPEGENLSKFDQAYYRKAEAAMQEDHDADDSRSVTSTKSSRSIKSVIPKLPPPRFVPREQAIHATPNMPSMPKGWPQQTPSSPTSLIVGQERQVVFLSESLGIKLNRGTDGIVRVLTVIPETPGSPIVRNGQIEEGDVVREAAGVDIRRPITNIMWGDTVALIKMAPRPITLVVAEELSDVPASVMEERKKSLQNTSFFPDAASPVTRVLPGNDSLKEEDEEKDEEGEDEEKYEEEQGDDETEQDAGY